MIKRILPLILIVIFVSNLGASQILENQNIQSKLSLLESWINSKIAYEGWPGLAVGIVHDQDLIWFKGFGYADIDTQTPITDSTLFPIASNTKMFTAIAILMLRDEGKLRLDDPVINHLDWFKKIKSKDIDLHKITIRHLLTHSSGLPREAPFYYWADFNFPTSQQFVDKFDQLELSYPPETRWKYSNLGVSIEGSIVEEIAKMPYYKYIKQNILEPLGMRDSFVSTRETNEKQTASGYGRRLPTGKREKFPVPSFNAISPAAGLISNIKDLAKFASWQFRIYEGDKFEILEKNTLKEMQRVHWLDQSWEWGWGLGFCIYHYKDCELIGHGGHVAGYHTDFTINLDEKIGVITLTNADDIPVYPDESGSVSSKIFDWVVPEIKKQFSSERTKQEYDSTWINYTGKYRDLWNDYEVTIIDEKLVIIKPTSDNPLSSILILNPVKKHVFKIIEGGGFDAHGELVKFEEDEYGNIVRMKTGGWIRTKINKW